MSFLPEMKNICVPQEPAVSEVGRVGLSLAGQEGILGEVDCDVLRGDHDYWRPWEGGQRVRGGSEKRLVR